MANASIAADLDQALDVQLNFTAQIALDLNVFVDIITQKSLLVFGKVANSDVRIHTGRFKDLLSCLTADAVDVCQPYFDSLFLRQVDACNTCHMCMNTSQKNSCIQTRGGE